jgi:hypothetical protein
MRADQRRNLRRTMPPQQCSYFRPFGAGAQTTYYSPGGDYLGQGSWRRNTATFYDAKGNFVGTSSTVGRSTSFFGRDGAFQGTLSRTGDTTNFYDRAGRYQGYVTTRATAGFGWHNPFQEAVVKPQARATPRTSAFAQGLLR